MIKIEKRLFPRVILSVLAASALSLDMGIPDLHLVPEIERNTLLNMPEILWNFYGSFNLKAFPVLAVSIFYFCSIVDKKYKKINMKERALIAPLSLFFSAVFVMSEAFCMSDTLAVLYSPGGGQMFKTLVSLVGLFYLFYQLISFFYLFLDNQRQGDIKQHNFLKTFLMILMTWVPYIIILYPGTIVSDAGDQLYQFFGISSWSSHHPPFSSLVMGIIFSIGSVIGGNFAIFLYCLIQTVIFALILAYMLGLFATLRTPEWLWWLTLFCIFTVPYYTNYIMVMMKDEMYSYCFLLFVIELIYMSIKGFDYFRSKRHVLLWVLSAAGTILFRNNGKYSVYPTVALLCLYFVYKNIRNHADIKKSLWAAGYVLSPVIISAIISSALVLHLDIKNGSIAEALSFPLQQTARYVYYHQNEVTTEEEAILRSVLDYDNLAQNYNPRVSDPVKETFKHNPSYRDFIEYLRVWAVQGIKHPETYLVAVMNQNYYLFYPLVPNNIVMVGLDGLGGFSNLENGADYENELTKEFNIHTVDILSKPQKILFFLYQLYFYLPVIGWFAHPAIYTICLICLCAFACVKKLKKWLFVSMPVFISFLVVILAPAIQRHPRYAFPIIYSVPLLLVYYLYCNRNA